MAERVSSGHGVSRETGEGNDAAPPVYDDKRPSGDAAFFTSGLLTARTPAASLARTIENEIIPRLLMAHKIVPETLPAPAPDVISAARPDEIAALIALVTHEALPRAQSFIDALCVRGVSVHTVVVDLLPAAARYVGWLWETDACTFVDVTCALSRLKLLLLHYGSRMSRDMPVPTDGRRVLLSVMPGEQHTFGINVVEEMLRGGAWDVVPLVPTTKSELLRGVADSWFDVLGLSAAGDAPLDAMKALIPSIRRASLNKSIKIIAGGAAVLRSPELAAAAGVDAVVTDMRNGMEQMDAMVGLARRAC